ncbi:MAG: rhamnogalacturonan acetylesterase, partial [Verrucomicrobiales bacterium]
GLTLRSFDYQKRLEKILSMMKKGDYLFIQFGHNDQKDKREGAGPFTTYKASLEKFVAATREKGGIPVLVTPMERRRWSGGQPRETLSDFAEAVRQTAREQKTALIDLHAMSLQLYGALGESDSKGAFAFYPAGTFPGRLDELKDNTHHNNEGAYLLARCVLEGIKKNIPELAARVREDLGDFSPENPPKFSELHLPHSPFSAKTDKPAGD